jgi:hypothetical protein
MERYQQEEADLLGKDLPKATAPTIVKAVPNQARVT